MAIEMIRRKSETIYKAFFCKNRKRISKCFYRKFDAQKWLEDQEKLHQFGFKKKLKFSEATQVWLENHSRIRKAPGSYLNDKRMMDSFELFFGECNLDEVSPESIEFCISKMNSKGLKTATINRYLQCLRALFNYFIKKRHLTFNPVSMVGLLTEAEASYDYLSFEEANQFLAYCSEKYEKKNRWVYRLYLLAINTGMRWGEIAALQWDKADFLYQRITISRSYCGYSKQIRETTKGRKIRYVGINSSLLPELKVQREETVSSHLLFSLNEKILDLKNFKRDHFNKDLQEAGIRKIRFHDFRHTFASHFVMKGGNLYDLQKLLGHSDISTTERYAHLSPESIVARTELVAIDGGKNNVINLQERMLRKVSL